MTQVHIVSIAIAIFLIVVGSIGFLRKKWSIRVFTYAFAWASVSLFIFGIAPLDYPDLPLSKQLSRILFSSIVGLLGTALLLESILKRKKANKAND